MRMLRKINEVFPLYFVACFAMLGLVYLNHRFHLITLPADPDIKIWVITGLAGIGYAICVAVAYIFRYR